ncbi:MAG: pyruvate kinase [Clostridiales bacterium]|nr:pyruvate kinase [Clostridiales bacterium]
MKKTKIVCTVGPASSDKETLRQMINAGMDVMRLNFSHGSHEEHKERIDMMKELRNETGRHIGIMLDTKGPEIRTGVFESPVTLEQGQKFVLTSREIVGNKEGCSVTYKDLPKDISPGGRIMIDDGLIELKVETVEDTDINCIVVNSGTVSSRKGINLPGVRTNLPSITEKDKEDLIFGASSGVDFIAASFVRKPEDVDLIRDILDQNGGSEIKIIAKIENQEGVENLNEILAVADGIMVARGDMGVELAPEQIPLIQKKMIRACNKAGKPVITATQMLDSMMRNPRPTRAEVGDVANAILDGTDCIMLSGETAAGKYPVGAVEMMRDIAVATEESLDYQLILEKKKEHQSEDVTNAIGYATVIVAENLNAAMILTASSSGFAGRMVSKFRPKAPIFVTTDSIMTARRLSVTWGVYPVIIKEQRNEEEIYKQSVEAVLAETDFLKKGDKVIFTAGFPFGKSGSTNMMKVHVIK